MRLLRVTVLLLVVLVYVLVVGQNWGHYAAALMLAAYARHDGRLLSPA